MAFHGQPPQQSDGLILRVSFRLFDRWFRRWLGARNTGAQWAVLLVLSAACFLVLETLHLPAALLLGPMVAAIWLASSEARVRVPTLPFFAAQAVVGCLVARGLPASILPELQKDWPVFAVVIVLVVGSSTGLGWLLARLQVLPGTTAVWGASPGAAAAMTLMSEAYGADMRLVAFMQYLRVVFVVALASSVSALWAVSSGRVAEIVWFPPVNWPAFAATLAVAGVGGVLGRVLRVPAGALMVPLMLGVVLQGLGAAHHRAAAVAAGGVLRHPRLDHRPALHARHHRPRGTRHAARHRRDTDADRVLRRDRRPAGGVHGRRSVDGLSRHQPRRGGYGGDHRVLEQC